MIEKIIPLNNVSNASDLVALRQMQWENNKLIERKLNEIINYINNNNNIKIDKNVIRQYFEDINKEE